MSLPGTMRVPKRAHPESTYDPYTTLISAILARAVADASGDTLAPGPQTPSQVEREARDWLSDGAQVAALVELTGLDSAPVLRRVRALLADIPLQTPTAVGQLALF